MAGQQRWLIRKRTPNYVEREVQLCQGPGNKENKMSVAFGECASRFPRTQTKNGGIMSTVTAKPERVDQFFTVAEARFDRWRALLQAARTWEAAANRQPSEKEKQQEATSASFQELRQWEDFFAYPGEALLRTLGERITSGDATGTAHL